MSQRVVMTQEMRGWAYRVLHAWWAVGQTYGLNADVCRRTADGYRDKLDAVAAKRGVEVEFERPRGGGGGGDLEVVVKRRGVELARETKADIYTKAPNWAIYYGG